MQIRLNERAEKDAQDLETAIGRVLKGIALISVAGAIIAKGLPVAGNMNLGMFTDGLAILVVLVCGFGAVFLFAIGAAIITPGIAAFGPHNASPFVQNAVGFIFAICFTVIATALFYGEMAAVKAHIVEPVNPPMACLPVAPACK